MLVSHGEEKNNMAQHELLRNRIEQHKIKNILSKIDDKDMKQCSQATVELLKEQYPNHIFTIKYILLLAGVI
jgi:hypothetical protein